MMMIAAMKIDQRVPADRQLPGDLDALGGDAAGLEALRVGGEPISSAFWMITDRPNVTRIGRVSSVPEREVEQPALEDVADDDHQHDAQEARPEHAQAEPLDEEQRDEGGQDAEVAVRQVDDAHHPEDQREPDGEQRVESAEQDPLDGHIHPIHAVTSRSRLV